MRVNSTKVINVPTSTVWEGVTEEGHLAVAHPYVESHTHDGPMQRGATDRIVYLNGLTFDRHFTDWREGEGYTLLIGRPQGRSRSRVEWHIESLGPTQSSLSITVHPDLLQRMPGWLRWVAFRWKVKPLLKAYLDAVTGGMAHWLETGTPVHRSDHPDHPWFGNTLESPSP
jgi:hypothetical protein